MAKDPDKLAADFDAEGSGFLAEEEAVDRRLLWRLGSWGLGAVGAVTIAVMANQSALTLKRDLAAASDISRQAQQLQTLTRESHSETRRLASAIDTLSSDRDRLYSRMTSLEQNLESVTGAITRQAVAPPPSASTAAPVAINAPAAQPPAQSPAPTVAPVAVTPPASDKPAAAEKAAAPPDKTSTPPEKPAAVAEKPANADKTVTAATRPQGSAEPPAPPDSPSVAAAPVGAVPVATAAGPEDKKPAPLLALVADKAIIGPPDPAAGKPIEPVKPPPASGVTAAPIPPLVVAPDPDSEIEDDAGAPKAQIQRTEFGIDLGTANSVNGLRALWRGLLRSKANAPLAALRPIIVIKENTNGLGMQLRLVAGPLNDAGTAAKICASLSLNQRTCETAIYDGQRLALKNDDPPAASRPVHRRAAPRRAVAPPPPPPVAEEKKPEPTTFSSMFRRNSQ